MEKIVIENLNKRVNAHTVSNVSLKVHSSEIFALVGMTGSGKSIITGVLHNFYVCTGTC